LSGVSVGFVGLRVKGVAVFPGKEEHATLGNRFFERFLADGPDEIDLQFRTPAVEGGQFFQGLIVSLVVVAEIPILLLVCFFGFLQAVGAAEIHIDEVGVFRVFLQFPVLADGALENIVKMVILVIRINVSEIVKPLFITRHSLTMIIHGPGFVVRIFLVVFIPVLIVIITLVIIDTVRGSIQAVVIAATTGIVSLLVVVVIPLEGIHIGKDIVSVQVALDMEHLVRKRVSL
jgi:hypothetical protein